MTLWSPALGACARWAFAGGPAPDLGALSDEEWRRLLYDAQSNRLAGLVAAVVAERNDLDPARIEPIADLEAEWALHSLRAERTMLEVTELLEREQVPYRVLKGSAFAHGHWPSPELRSFGDADILVRSADLDAVVELTVEAGASRSVPQVRRGFDRRFSKSVTMRSADGVEIDWHRTLVAGPHTFLVPEQDLWTDPALVQVAGRSIPCFPPSLQLLHAATHAVASRSPRATNLLDVAFIAPHADLADAAGIAERWQLRAVVRAAGERVEALLGDSASLVTTWAKTLAPTDEEGRLRDLFVGETSFRRSALAAAPYIPGRLDRVRFLASLAYPSRAHRRAR